MWQQIGGQPSILSPERYGHVDWSMYMLPFLSLNSFVTILLFYLFSVTFFFPSFKNSLGLLFKFLAELTDSVFIFCPDTMVLLLTPWKQRGPLQGFFLHSLKCLVKSLIM